MYPTRLYLFGNTIPSLKIQSYCGCNVTEYDSYNWTRQNRLNANFTLQNLQNALNAQNTFSTFCWCRTINIQIYLRIPIDLVNLEVKPWLSSSVLSTSSVSKSTRILLFWSPELLVHLQFYITDISITLYTSLFSVHSLKQVIDREESKTILGVRRKSEDQPNRGGIQSILLLGYSAVGTTPSAEAKLLSCFFYPSR